MLCDHVFEPHICFYHEAHCAVGRCSACRRYIAEKPDRLRPPLNGHPRYPTMLTSLSEAATRNYDYIVCGEFLHPDVPARLTHHTD
jgi:hypothetical protein